MPKHRTISPQVEEKARELMNYFELLASEVLAESGDLSRREATVLRFLATNGPANMSDVSAAAGLALSTSTGLIDRLVERQLVERDRPADDRRTVMITLSRRGQRDLERFNASKVALGARILEALSPAERETLLEMFRK